MHPSSTLGQRVQRVRKLRGLTQRELAARAGIGLKTLQVVEQDAAPVRASTIHAIAKTLHVTTDSLDGPGEDRPDWPGFPDPLTADPWQDVRTAMYQPGERPGDQPSERDVLRRLRRLMPLLAANRYEDARAQLPALIEDSAALGRTAQSRVLNATAWLLTQTRQWEDAMTAARQAMDAATDYGDKVAAANTMCWCLLRQGLLADAAALAVRQADEAEPRISRATPAELAGWGKLWLYVNNAATRNNEPGRAQDALRIAEAAAARIGREVETDRSTTRTFGPVTVPMIKGEAALLSGQPDRALAIAGTIPEGRLVHAMSASVLRHHLDVAGAYSQLRQYGDAVDVLEGMRLQAPEWLPQQQAARDLVEDIVERRRTLTPQMRGLAAAVRLDV